MEILLVPTKEVPLLWNEVEPLIDKALYGEENLLASDFKDSLEQAESFMWIIVDGPDIESVVVGTPTFYPRKQSLSIDTWATKSGYKFDQVYPLIEEIKKFAREIGCDFIEAKVRKGLAKKLKWNDKHSLVTLTL